MYVFKYPLTLFIRANHSNKSKWSISINVKSKISNGGALVGQTWPKSAVASSRAYILALIFSLGVQ